VSPVSQPAIPELVEQAIDELAETLEEMRVARNAIADGTVRALATEQLLLQMRAATNSVERTEHPDEVNLVLPTPEWLANRRRRHIRTAVCVLVIVLLAVVLAVV
jgi:CO/xanthine dehydrogenase FAD-binding subunit